MTRLFARAGQAQHDSFPWKDRKDEPVFHELYWLWMHPLLTVYLAVILPIGIVVSQT